MHARGAPTADAYTSHPPNLTGCGFVTYSNEDSARSAIAALSDTCVLGQNGKPLVVKFAEGLRQRMEHKLCVTNLPLEMEEEEASALFSPVRQRDPSKSTLRVRGWRRHAEYTYTRVGPPRCECPPRSSSAYR